MFRNDRTSRKYRRVAVVPAIIGMFVGGGTPLLAQVVELNPGFIAGEVQIGTTAETNINRAELRAGFSSFSAFKFITPNPLRAYPKNSPDA